MLMSGSFTISITVSSLSMLQTFTGTNGITHHPANMMQESCEKMPYLLSLHVRMQNAVYPMTLQTSITTQPVENTTAKKQATKSSLTQITHTHILKNYAQNNRHDNDGIYAGCYPRKSGGVWETSITKSMGVKACGSVRCQKVLQIPHVSLSPAVSTMHTLCDGLV